jgi:cytochrome c oxidase subunit 3
MLPPSDLPPPSSHDAAPHLFGPGRRVLVGGAGTLGIALLVLALSVLFAASLIGYLIFRSEFTAPITVPLPPGLWLSTLILLVSSGTMHAAWRSVRAGQSRRLRGALQATLLLGTAFLLVQSVNWLVVYGALHHVDQALTAVAPTLSPMGGLRAADAPLVEQRVLLAMFYVFTILHAIHVVGGLIPLAVVNVRAAQGVYSPNYYPGVRYCLIYWHFLDLVWLLIFLVLLATF